MKAYDTKPWAILKSDFIWNNIQSMVVDALQGPGRMYVRGAGWQEAWAVGLSRIISENVLSTNYAKGGSRSNRAKA